MHMNRKAALAMGAGMAAMMLAACSDSPMAPSASSVAPKPSFAVGDTPAPTPAPVLGKIVVCKTGNAGGTFDVTRTATGASVGTVSGLGVSIPTGTCLEVANDFGGNGVGSNVTINEAPADNTVQTVASCKFMSAPSMVVSDCSFTDGGTLFLNSFHAYVIVYNNAFTEPPPPPSGCTFTQGYWKTHGPSAKGNNSNEWPVTSLTLGTQSYSAAQLQTILNTAVKGNGLISLAHQLIAAKLNIENGASDASIAATITAADAAIGSLTVGVDTLSPASVASLVDALTAFNEGTTGPGHCSDEVLVS